MLLVIGIVVVGVIAAIAVMVLRNNRETDTHALPVRRTKAYDVGGREGRVPPARPVAKANGASDAAAPANGVARDVAVVPEVVPEVVVSADGGVVPNVVGARNGVVVPSTAAPVAEEPARVAAPTASAQAHWPERIDPRSGPLPEEARLRLLGDLGMLRAAWCVPILAQAYTEESDPALRRAALTALAGSRRPEARATLELALERGDPEERTIAQNGLAALPADDAPLSS